MPGRPHGVCVSACWFVPPQCGFSLSLFCSNHAYSLYQQGSALAPLGEHVWKLHDHFMRKRHASNCVNAPALLYLFNRCALVMAFGLVSLHLHCVMLSSAGLSFFFVPGLLGLFYPISSPYNTTSTDAHFMYRV